MNVLNKIFGLEEFRESQGEIVRHITEGKNCLVIMPTGMGKSLCYQLPALLFDGLTLVISPLISLMKDQVDGLRSLGVDAAYINSSLGNRERESRYRELRDGKYRILFISPERFRKKEFIDAVRSRQVSLLAVDEAHCVSRWGGDFRPDYSKICQFREALGNPVIMALTATATKDVQNDIIIKTGIASGDLKIFNEGILRPNLSLAVRDTIDEAEKFGAIRGLLDHAEGSAIVYFNLIGSIEKFSAFMDMKGRRYSVYHGKLAAGRRRDIQGRFMGSASMVMLATNAFGMGVDKADIRMIIHAEIPDSVESYYQEVGRAGRDGKESRCVLFYDQNDLAVQIQFLEWKNPDAVFIRNAYSLFESLGDSLSSYTYEDLQEKLVFKNRSDHRLQTVLNLFDRYRVTEGSTDTLNLKLVSEVPDEIISPDVILSKQQLDKEKLVKMLDYVKTPECRRDFIHRYFDAPTTACGNCDNCRKNDTIGAGNIL